MDRLITNIGESIYEWMLSAPGQKSMVAIAKLAAAMFGTNTTANGLSCAPTSPASLQVVVNPGEIYSLANLEASVCGTLPVDSAHQILKQGILLDAFTTSTLAAPGTAGQSINYLIEAQYADSDVSIDPTTGSSPVVLQFYNSTNPTQPFSGPGGNGQTSTTFRKGIVSLQVKAGAAATTGTQTTPSPDAGWVGLWVVTVANGQSTITAGNIAQYAGAPILPSSLLASIQNGNLSYAVATGTANAHVVALNPALTARVDGMVIRYKAPAANTGAVTLNDGVGTVQVLGGNHAALQGGEYIQNGDAFLVWNSSISGGAYILVECTGGALQIPPATASQHAAQISQVQSGAANVANDTGAANALVAALSPTPASLAAIDGAPFAIKIANNNTGATTLNLNGLGVKNVYGLYGVALQGGELVAGGRAFICWSQNVGAFFLLNCQDGALQIAPGTQSQHAVQLGQLENTSSPLPLATAPASLAAHAVPFSQIPVVVGSMRNAKMVVTAASSSATFTADEIMVESALGGLAYRMAVYSKTINLATTGAGGMDTGSPPANGWVALYAILNPSTSTASILATNCTSAAAPNIYGGANMPAGYTASALISVWSTNASGQFNIGVQRDRMRSFPSVAALTTSTSAGSYTTLNTTTIPLNAISAQFTLFANNNTGSSMSMNIASDSSGSGQQSVSGFVTANDAIQDNASILISTPQTLYYSSASGAGTPTYQIVVSGFSF